MEPELQTKAVQIIDQLTAGLKAVAPQMADLTLAAVHFQGVMHLIGALAGLVLVLGLAFTAYKLMHTAVNRIDDNPAVAVPCGIGAVLGAVVALIVGSVNLMQLFDTYMWAAVVDPKLAVALQVLHKVL